MAAKWFSFERESAVSFNLTPVIDIVFLLIIFFALVFKFIEAENFPVTVPENCRYAQSEIDSQAALATITIMKNEDGKSDFAVGAEIVTGANYGEIVNKLAILIDSRLKGLPADKRIVTLRIDKDIPYAEAQYALAAVAKSTATDIRLAAIKDSSVAR
jgi:biopolymer transport protein ExbD